MNAEHKQPLIPATYFCKEPRICNWVRRNLISYAVAATTTIFADAVDETNPFVMTESLEYTAIPYFLVLGWFDGKYVALMVDEGLRHIYEVPVIADRAFFRSGTIVMGELVWEYAIVTHQQPARIVPRQIFLINRLLKVAGVEIPTVISLDTWSHQYTTLRNLFDPLDKDVLQKPRQWNEEARKLALMHRKIVCAGTCFGLSFRPHKWFLVSEKDIMMRTYIPTLRYEIDTPLHVVTIPKTVDPKPTRPYFHLLLQPNVDEDLEIDWRIYCRTDDWEKIDATLAGPIHLIFLPNELTQRWIERRQQKKLLPSIVLVHVTHMISDTIFECEPVMIRSEKALADSLPFIQRLLASLSRESCVEK